MNHSCRFFSRHTAHIARLHIDVGALPQSRMTRVVHVSRSRIVDQQSELRRTVHYAGLHESGARPGTVGFESR
jgi:hypothetical protein